jgi:hypothetical protein
MRRVLAQIVQSCICCASLSRLLAPVAVSVRRSRAVRCGPGRRSSLARPGLGFFGALLTTYWWRRYGVRRATGLVWGLDGHARGDRPRRYRRLLFRQLHQPPAHRQHAPARPADRRKHRQLAARRREPPAYHTSRSDDRINTTTFTGMPQPGWGIPAAELVCAGRPSANGCYQRVRTDACASLPRDRLSPRAGRSCCGFVPRAARQEAQAWPTGPSALGLISDAT